MNISFKVLIVVFLIFCVSIISATIINVPGDQPTIQVGINVAVDADTVLVQPGTYVENINYNGKLITVASLFLTTQDTTYISQTIINGSNSDTVVKFESGEESTAVLCGFTVTNGSAEFGGGIYCFESNPVLIDVTISNNEADSLGGGIHCRNNSSPSLDNVTISGNSADSGGGISCSNSSPSLQNVTISGNSAWPWIGGGIWCDDNCSPSLDNVTITDNSAGWSGGIHFNESNPSLMNVTITGNSAYWYGGGIACYNSSASLVDVVISNNSAYYGGGIFCGGLPSPSLVDVVISDNLAYFDGGGIFCWDSSPSLVNVTITGNYVDYYGGGISCLDSSNPTLTNVTISGNTAGMGGGIYFSENSSSELIDCILWNDSPQEIYFTSTGDPNSITISYSDIQGGEAGIVTNNNGTVNWLEGNISEDPLFVGTGDHPFMLQDLSPCVNAGIPDTTGLNLPEYDLAGNPRVYGGRIDMGAYENQNVVGANEDLIPLITKLNQNYPNPFNPTTTINYSLKENSKVLLNIYNIKGQKIKTIVNEKLEQGLHQITWDGKNDNNQFIASGVYFYKLKVNNKNIAIKKCLLLK